MGKVEMSLVAMVRKYSAVFKFVSKFLGLFAGVSSDVLVMQYLLINPEAQDSYLLYIYKGWPNKILSDQKSDQYISFLSTYNAKFGCFLTALFMLILKIPFF